MKYLILFFLTTLILTSCKTQNTRNKEMIEFLSERTKDRTNTLRLIDGDFSLNKLEDSISLKDIANIKALESKGYAMYKDKVYLNDSINAYKNIEDYFNLIEVSQAVDYINLNINSTKTIFDILSVDSYYTDYVYSPVYIIKKLSYEDGSSTNINDTLREFDFIKPDKFESSKKLKSILINIEFDYPIVNQYNLNRENNIGTIEREKVRLTKMSNKSLQLILPTSINERIVGINPICYNGKVLQKKSGGSSTLFPRNHQEKWLNFNKKMKQKVINNTFIDFEDFYTYYEDNAPRKIPTSGKFIEIFQANYYAEVRKVELFIRNKKFAHYSKQHTFNL